MFASPGGGRGWRISVHFAHFHTHEEHSLVLNSLSEVTSPPLLTCEGNFRFISTSLNLAYGGILTIYYSYYCSSIEEMGVKRQDRKWPSHHLLNHLPPCPTSPAQSTSYHESNHRFLKETNFSPTGADLALQDRREGPPTTFGLNTTSIKVLTYSAS